MLGSSFPMEMRVLSFWIGFAWSPGACGGSARCAEIWASGGGGGGGGGC